MGVDEDHLQLVRAIGVARRRLGPGDAFRDHVRTLPTVVACERCGSLTAIAFDGRGFLVVDGDDLPPQTTPPSADAADHGPAGRVPDPRIAVLTEKLKRLAQDDSVPVAERTSRLQALLKQLTSLTHDAHRTTTPAPGTSPGGDPASSPTAAGASKRCSVPDSDAAVLVSSGNEPWLPHLQDRLEASGYDVTMLTGAGVDTYRTLPSGGVLLINAHSAPAWSLANGGREFAIWTADQVNVAHERAWADEIARGDIIKYFRGELLDFAHYAITDAFVAKHFPKLARNSLVVLESCHGGAASAAPLRQALRDKGADVVAGWSWKVPDQLGGGTQWYLFDRLTGGGDAVTVDLSGYGGSVLTIPSERDATGFEQRPFDWPHVETDMLSKGLGIFHSPDLSYLTRLIFEPGAGRFGTLRPSIATLSVDESTSLMTVTGLFGKGPYSGRRAVTVGGVDVPWTRWDDEEIECGPLPRSGAGSYGEVVVHIGRRTSNVVPLTSWRSTFTLTCTIPGQKKPFATLTGPLLLRGDVHPSRELPGRRPGARTMVAQLVADPDAPATFTLAGTDKAAQFTYTWTFSGKVAPGASTEGAIVCWLKASGVDVVHPQLRLEAAGFARPLGSVVLTDRASGKRYELQASCESVQITGRDADLLRGSVTWTPGDYAVPDGERSGAMEWGVEPPVTFPAKLTWTPFTCSFAPTPDTPA